MLNSEINQVFYDFFDAVQKVKAYSQATQHAIDTVFPTYDEMEWETIFNETRDELGDSSDGSIAYAVNRLFESDEKLTPDDFKEIHQRLFAGSLEIYNRACAMVVANELPVLKASIQDAFNTWEDFGKSQQSEETRMAYSIVIEIPALFPNNQGFMALKSPKDIDAALNSLAKSLRSEGVAYDAAQGRTRAELEKLISAHQQYLR